ncbi:MAG: hypothetical protein AVDCRST_MAG56-5032 [uncultured Cytophagales bacterium]|uniref:DoxX family protein n=1 Tax=uncultured Cytophagales bacterium TaxID=158755 RepID=A0A6J4K4Y8_9SPHI|nr:MAG: hypothetical protein AVDCRST_MAG56-5032 [uncultured Cytophagales bacterium]
MTKPSGIAQLFLRLALGIGFLLPVLDRLGWLGLPGTGKVNWGDWLHFVDYTHSLVPFVSRPLAGALGGLATIAEIVFGICLIVGYQLRAAALGSAILTFIFGVCMAASAGIAAPFNYPVFVFTGAGLVLAERRTFSWSIDNLLEKKARKLQMI